MSTEPKYQTVWVATVNGSAEHDTPWGAAALAAANYMAGRPDVKTFKDCPAFALRPEYGPYRSLGPVEAWRFEEYFRSQCSLEAILAARKVLKDRFPYAYRRAILELDRIYIELMPRTCTTRPKASRDPARIEQALDALLMKISDGWEFPDAAWHIARKFGVDLRALEAAYDRR